MIDDAELLNAGRSLTGLEFKARRIVDGFLAGRHRGPRRGSSAEFAEHREYAPGDDLRYLDWKVFGKHDRYYLKQLEQETNFVCHLLLDVSDSMRYRSDDAPRSKLDAACLTAAALASLVLRQQDEVDLTAFAGTVETVTGPSGHPSHLAQIAASLEAISARDPLGCDSPSADTVGALRRLHDWAEQIRRRAVMVVLSDCLGDLHATVEALRHLRSRRHDVLLLHVVDPAEQEFPFLEPTLFRDVESDRTQSVDCRQLRAAYCAEFDAFRRRLETECSEMGTDYLLLRTDAPIERPLAAFLARRARQGQTG